jgi:hypothetical protein
VTPPNRRDHHVARVVEGQPRWVVLVYGEWTKTWLFGSYRRRHWRYTRIDAVGLWQLENGWLLPLLDERIEELDSYISPYQGAANGI